MRIIDFTKHIRDQNNQLFIQLFNRDSAARWIAAPGDDGKTRVHEAVRAVTLLLRRYFPGTAVYPIGQLINRLSNYNAYLRVIRAIQSQKQSSEIPFGNVIQLNIRTKNQYK